MADHSQTLPLTRPTAREGAPMTVHWTARDHLTQLRYVAKWLAIGIPAGGAIGSAVAAFLWLLDRATNARLATERPWLHGLPWLLLLLPLGGLAVGALYHAFGKSVVAGNNLIVDEIHQPGGGVPARMGPLVLIGTVVTHLFGGSAGREGTAVQMGGSIASQFGRLLRLDDPDTRTLLTAGVAAGFGAVFGTPLTGAIFAAEVLAIGVIRFDAIVPALIASVAGDWTTRAWGIHHTGYAIHGLVQSTPGLNWLLLAKVAAAAVGFGFASVLFAELTYALQRAVTRLITSPLWRPAVGGLAVIALAFAVGPDYLGLGVTNPPGQVSILSCFTPGGAAPWSWWWKLALTAVTLASGFKGGEVTPLFFIGAALGNAIARLLHAPVDLFAGLGFVAVFAAATNTPLACTVMAVELFGDSAGLVGGGFAVYAAVACFVAYLVSGHTGIYPSQRIERPKVAGATVTAGASLKSLRRP